MTSTMKNLASRFTETKKTGHFANRLVGQIQKTFSLLILTLLVSAVASLAQTSTNLFWDPNGTNSGIGGTGTYSSTTGTQWSATTNGTSVVSGGWTTAAVTNWGGNIAIFAGTAGTVTFSNASLPANQVQINTTAYTFRNATNANQYIRAKNGIFLGDGVNVNISSPILTNGVAFGFEGMITNASGATGTSITVTGATANADSSVRVVFDGAGSVAPNTASVYVPIRIATTGSGYASLRSVGGDAKIYGSLDVNSGSRLVLQGGTNGTGSRTVQVFGNLTTVNTDLVINEVGDNGTVILAGSNSIGGNVLLAFSKLGYGSKNAFGNSVIVISNGTSFGQGLSMGSLDSDRTINNAIILRGDATFGLGTYGSYLAGNLDLNGATRTISLGNSTYFNGAVTNGGINLSSSSATRTLYLNGNNTYAGGTTHNGGIISLGNNNGLGVGSLTVMSNNLSTNVIVVTNSGIVVTNTNVTTISNTLTVSADRSTANTINLLSGAVYTMDTSSNNWTHVGVISGAGSITKTGVGSLTLSGSNSYSSGTMVANGSLVVVKPNVTATITSNSITLVFTNGTANGNYTVLPSALSGTYPAASFSGLANDQRATFNASTGVASVSPKLSQAITFGYLNSKSYGDAAFALGATADSGLPVSYSSSNPNVATVSGNTVTVVGAGTTVITASQAGNTNYLPATDVSQTLTVLASVDGATISLNFQVPDLAVPLSEAHGWSSNDPIYRPDGYATDSINSGNILGYLGGFVNAPANETTQLTYNFGAKSSDRFVFEWNQNITTSSNELPGNDVFGWKFLSGNNTAFSIRFLNDSSLGRDLLVQAYDGSGNALSLGAGQVNDWFIDRDDANDFRVTADLASKKWALDVFNKSNNSWYGLVLNAAIDPSITSLNGMAATWTVSNSTVDNTTGQYTAAGDNIMTFDDVTIQGKQTVVISLIIPTNAVYNGSVQTASASTTPNGVAVLLKYNGSTNAPTNAGTYTVTAEVVDTTAYFSTPVSGSLVVAKATPTIATAPTASAINAGQALSASSLSGGSATGAGGASVAGGFAFTYPSTVPPAGTANRSVTFTPSGADAANYLTATVNVSVTVNQTTTPAEDYLSSFGLSGADAALSADPDNDGLTNAAEFAFGTSPVAATGTPVVVSEAAGSLKITFLGRSSGVNYVVKTTSDLSASFSGSSAPAAVSPQPSGLPTGYTQYEASVDTTSGVRKFLKVDATLQ